MSNPAQVAIITWWVMQHDAVKGMVPTMVGRGR